MQSLSVFDQFVLSTMNPDRLYKLSAIWMDRAIKFENGSQSKRVAPGTEVRVLEGFIATEGSPTHVVTECWGTLNNSKLFFDLRELGTETTSRIQVK